MPQRVAMIPNSSKAQTAHDVYHSILAAREHAYNAGLGSGHHEPFVYPWDTFPAALLFLAILLLPRVPRRFRGVMKTGASAGIFCLCLQTMLRVRSLVLANGYAIGLMCAWGMIMTVALLFCNDIEIDMQRLEWRNTTSEDEKHFNGTATRVTAGAEISAGTSPIKRRVYGMNGPAVSVNRESRDVSADKPAIEPYTLVWQKYPSSILHSMEWSADLMATFRGVGWNWRIPSCPPLDIPIRAPMGKFKPRSVANISSSKPTSVSLSTLRELQLTGIRDYAVQYLMLDFLKTVMLTDQYFMGSADLSSPSPWPFLTSSGDPTTTTWLLIRCIRLTISMCSVLALLSFSFSHSPLFFVSFLTTVVHRGYLRSITRSPILEPCLYPPYWQSLATIATGGLAGLWGKCWHQMFRFGISEPSRALIQHFGLERKGQPARLLQVGIAFALSGFIHASASSTTFSASKPLSGPFTFFVLQGVGIVLQQQLASVAKNHLHFAYRRPIVQKTSNILFVMGWLFLTGPLLADDFARCGLWFFEPLPVSLFRGIVWNEWWTWRNMSAWFGWRRGTTWYKSGLAIY